MITLGNVPAQQVLNLLAQRIPRGIVTDTEGNEHNVKLCKSQRLRVFAKSLQCVRCPRKGVIFKLQKHLPDNPAHLNLFSEDGTLMTKDHIIPKSKGGRDYMNNYQTMCIECNMKKGPSYES